MFSNLTRGLAKTRDLISGVLLSLFSSSKNFDEDSREELEAVLLQADINIATVTKILDRIEQQMKSQVVTSDSIVQTLKGEMLSLLTSTTTTNSLFNSPHKPYILLIIGVNGTGKTTTTGKIAHAFKKQGKKVLLAACDTFRTGAIEQLEIWAQRVGIEIIKQKSGADPASVAFDALKSARAHDYDVVLIDTAGRLHTKSNLIEELKKIKRVIGKEQDGGPHETVLVLDATIGQNSLAQARTFNDTIGVTGLAITKLDGTAKGGILLTVKDELDIPVKLIGFGEQVEDLKEFDAKEYVEALFHA